MAEPQRYIAIRLDAASDAVPGVRFAGSAAAVRERREHALPAMAAMATAGLEEEAPVVDALPPDPDIGGYVVLPETQSLILEPPAETSLEDLAEALGDEYLVMPDVALTLPEAPAGQEGVSAGEVRTAADALPAESGVRSASEAGNLGEDVVAIVLDTGCDADHREFSTRTVDFVYAPLSGSLLREVRGFDTATHGTHVCGTIAGANVGIAPKADLIVGGVIESERLATTATRVWQTLTWLLQRIKEPRYEGKPIVLNMSLGFRAHQIEPGEFETTMRGMRLLLEELLEKEKILPVVAIGNDGPGEVRAPGYYPETLSVGAVTAALEPWPKSGGGAAPQGFGGGTSPDVAGIGVDVVSGTERDVGGTSWYGSKRGTSMAAPYVTGIAALVASATGLHGAALGDKLVETALPLDYPPDRVGSGLVRYAV